MCASTPEMPLSAKVHLVAEAADMATEVVLINHELRRIASGVGKLEGKFEPGFYKLKFVAGGQSEEKLVELDAEKGPVRIEAPPVRFESAVPLADSDAPADQVEAAAEQSKQVHVRFGAGGRLFLFARDVKGREETEPWRGVSVSTPAGRQLFDLETEGFRSAASVCGAVTASLEPGLYVLSVDTRVWGVQQMPVVVSPDWQTQVFLAARTLERSAPGGDMVERSARRADLFTASISMVCEERGFEPKRSSARLVEIARRSLERGRNIVQEGELREMLRGKFEDPMLGLLAGHLLLLSPKPDLDLLHEVVGNLHRLGLAEHPDLRALELALGPPAGIFDLPPMLRASWHRIVAASATATDLIPEGSPAFRIAPRVIGNAAWLVWRRPGPAEERRTTRDARRGGTKGKVAIERDLRWLSATIAEEETERSGTWRGPESFSLSRGVSEPSHGPGLDFLESNLMAAVESAARAGGPPPSVEHLVRTLGLPAANVEDLLERVLRKKGF